MKKLSVLFITLILSLALSACGNNSTGNGNTQPNNNSPSSNPNQYDSSIPSVSSNQDKQPTGQSPAITREKALETALQKAGVKQEDIRDLDIELDTEHGITVWEIDFEHENYEYSYDVNATTSEITKIEHETDD